MNHPWVSEHPINELLRWYAIATERQLLAVLYAAKPGKTMTECAVALYGERWRKKKEKGK